MNNKPLIIVESPSKAKTISKYLDDKYEVLASVGHIKDLPKKDLGVDIDDNFAIVEDILPDKKSFFKELIDLANKTNQVVIATDPDSDRLGIAVRDQNKNLLLLNGNQLMIVVFDYLLNKMNETTSLDTNYFIASTIVSTPMIKKIGGYHNVDVKLGLTGFKWIAKMIEDFPDQNFIAGGEESYGIMIGSKVRDKDAISATLLVSEMMSFYSEKNSSVFEELIKIYQKILAQYLL